MTIYLIMKREFGKTNNIILLYMNFISELNFNKKKVDCPNFVNFINFDFVLYYFCFNAKVDVPILPNIFLAS